MFAFSASSRDNDADICVRGDTDWLLRWPAAGVCVGCILSHARGRARTTAAARSVAAGILEYVKWSRSPCVPADEETQTWSVDACKHTRVSHGDQNKARAFPNTSEWPPDLDHGFGSPPLPRPSLANLP